MPAIGANQSSGGSASSLPLPTNYSAHHQTGQAFRQPVPGGLQSRGLVQFSVRRASASAESQAENLDLTPSSPVGRRASHTRGEAPARQKLGVPHWRFEPVKSPIQSRRAGYVSFLVGETQSKQSDPHKHLAALLTADPGSEQGPPRTRAPPPGRAACPRSTDHFTWAARQSRRQL